MDAQSRKASTRLWIGCGSPSSGFFPASGPVPNTSRLDARGTAAEGLSALAGVHGRRLVSIQQNNLRQTPGKRQVRSNSIGTTTRRTPDKQSSQVPRRAL
jgi:hypothetical protein